MLMMYGSLWFYFSRYVVVGDCVCEGNIVWWGYWLGC